MDTLSQIFEKSRLYSELLDTRQQLEQANQELQRLATIDELTGIANRRALDQRFIEEWYRATRAGTELSLLMIDIDHFKRYNDHLGHLAGDDCLRRIAEIISSSLRRAGDFAGRYGGEEFAVLLPNAGAAEAIGAARTLFDALSEANIEHPVSPIVDRITVSIGIATQRPSTGSSHLELVGAADKALYAAKLEGRNRLSVWRGPKSPDSSDVLRFT